MRRVKIQITNDEYKWIEEYAVNKEYEGLFYRSVNGRWYPVRDTMQFCIKTAKGLFDAMSKILRPDYPDAKIELIEECGWKD